MTETMRKSDFRADQAHAALLQRSAELKRQLEMRDQTKPHDFGQGFVFLIQGRERVALEQEAAFIDSVVAMLIPPDE